MPIDLKDVNSGYNLQTINDNFQTIESKWDEKLDRLSSEFGNDMKQKLDMNGFLLKKEPRRALSNYLLPKIKVLLLLF